MKKKVSKQFVEVLNLVTLIIVGLLAWLVLSNNVHASEVLTIYLDDKMIAPIKVTPRGTVLDFPTKPDNVALGQTKSFGLEYIKNDVVISPLQINARSNLFVYLLGRRYTFDLIASPQNGRTIVIVKDRPENQMKANSDGN